MDRIGSPSSSLARAAIEAALKRQADAAGAVTRELAGEKVAAPQQSGFAQALTDGLRSVSEELAKTDDLARDAMSGKVTDFSEIAAQLKQSDLSLRFTLEVRNKFIDAYREVMRMSV